MRCSCCRYLAALCFIIFLSQPVFSNNADYENRRQAYIDSALTNFSDDAITLQAYKGVPVDSATLHDILAGLSTKGTSDFDIVKLIRVLFFTNGAYDSQILPVLNQLPFWLSKDETLRVYWSENHMIMWMSSDWLLHERYGKVIDSSLDNRLRHYLRLKIQYGFYEFFSSVYLPYSLSGLLNLADFAQDTEIKNLAAQAAQRLLGDILMLTNDKGVYFPAAGRNYYGKYKNAYGQNHSSLIYLLTGKGEIPKKATHAGGFLASSTLEVDSVSASWTPYLNTIYSIGHSLDTGFVLNSTQAPMDKVIFQWSSGAYFHPDVAMETAALIKDSSLWNHVEFADFAQFQNISISSAQFFANLASPISKSSVIVGEDVAIFKSNSVTLSSVQNFWKGKLGYQEFPCVANVGTTAVLTASGEVTANWEDRPSINANEHLPYVSQKKNVALLMYRPEKGLAAFKHDSLAVALHWQDADFDEVTDNGLWLLGRQGSGYIAVHRSCPGQWNGIRACNAANGQTWVIMVGDTAMYGTFANFQHVVGQSQFTEEWYLDSSASPVQSVYYAKIQVDSVTIDYAWSVDNEEASAIHEVSSNTAFSVFPNPVHNEVSIDLSAFANEPVTLRVFNSMGQEVYYKEISFPGTYQATIQTAEWAKGIYLFVVESQQNRSCKKIIKE